MLKPTTSSSSGSSNGELNREFKFGAMPPKPTGRILDDLPPPSPSIDEEAVMNSILSKAQPDVSYIIPASSQLSSEPSIPDDLEDECALLLHGI
jgi:hypothetical protein